MSHGAAQMPCEGGAPTITFIGVTDINVVSRVSPWSESRSRLIDFV